MNHHMPGHPMQPGVPFHEQSRRQQQYHSHMYGAPPQSPIHANPYAYHPHHAPPQFYPQQHPQAPYTRWQPHAHSYMHQPMYGMPQPMQAAHPQTHHVPQYPPRSPMVVSSQPQPQLPQSQPGSMTPAARPGLQTAHSQYNSQPAANSPRPAPQQLSSFSRISAGLPSPAPTPPKREDVMAPMPSQPSPPVQEERQATPVSENTQTPALDSRRSSVVAHPLSLPPELRTPVYPKLPWYSPNATVENFSQGAKARRKRRQNLNTLNDTVALPFHGAAASQQEQHKPAEETVPAKAEEEQGSEASTIAAASERETPATSQAPSENDCPRESASIAVAQTTQASPKPASAQAPQHARKDTRSAIAVPNIPSSAKAKGTPPSASKQSEQTPPGSSQGPPVQNEQAPTERAEPESVEEEQKPAPKPAAPKSWADLVRSKNAAAAVPSQSNGVHAPNGTQNLPKSASLGDALRQYTVVNERLSFLEPRGLVNTGNMCYMNSILQVLVFCSPFYDFLDQVRQRSVHSMKSETPLVDALIMFMGEFKILTSSDSTENLRRVLNQQQLEQYGEPVTPEYVYDAIRRLPSFQGMRRGHQQDAEEFLGFLLEGLHDECVNVMQGQTSEKPPTANAEDAAGDGWLEVGPKQKSAVTRTAGQEDAPSPVTKIFGGHLRSELRVPGQKDSVVLEPYKPLQLDIGAPHVSNIVDALKGLTHTEALTGDFGGRGNTAKKQVFIDTLPPVLILHLKRFQYENSLGGTQKIWKKIGYPLELEIPKEVFPPSKRGGLAVKGGLPKYRLISVVYHHGKSAAGGHYTVDVLRQDSREWVRMDDTVIRRVRPQDVAEGGAEEDPKLLARALEQHKADQDLQKQRNMYEGLDEVDREVEDRPWSQVNGSAGPKWAAAAATTTGTNGTATPNSQGGKKTPRPVQGVKDNKVAYILLYERIRS